MILYFFKSTLCMLFLWGFYALILEKENAFIFNRFYLLGSLLFSFLIPNLTLDFVGISEPFFPPLGLESSTLIVSQEQPTPTYNATILWWIYGIVTVLLFLKYVQGIRLMITKITRNKNIKYGDHYIVLLAKKEPPHTFFKYIFLWEKDYSQNKIDDAILQHEIAHAQQLHSMDIVLIELLKVLFWFNPALYLYNRSIRINHEFLADKFALSNSNSLVAYQQLLLQSITQKQIFTNRFSSGINFSITKKRLIMMTKKTSKRKYWINTGLSVFMILVVTLLFSNNLMAQEGATPQEVKEYIELVMDNYDQEGEPTNLSKEEKERIFAIYNKMDKGQQIIIRELKMPYPKSAPKKFADSKTPPPPPPFPEGAKYFIDGKEVSIYQANMMLPNYKDYYINYKKGKNGKKDEFHMNKKD